MDNFKNYEASNANMQFQKTNLGDNDNGIASFSATTLAARLILRGIFGFGFVEPSLYPKFSIFSLVFQQSLAHLFKKKTTFFLFLSLYR
jgi:hypothetical protein